MIGRRRRGLVPPPALVPPYAAGTSWLHRLPAGAAVAGLVAVAVAAGWRRGPAPSAVVGVALLAVVVGAAVSARVPAAPLLRSVRALAPVLVLLAAWTALLAGPLAALGAAACLAASVLAAALVTATTPVGDLLDLVARCAGPLGPAAGERLALLVALVLRSVPHLLELALESREAARARGLERSVRAAAVPLVLRAVDHASATAEALAARGLGEG